MKRHYHLALMAMSAALLVPAAASAAACPKRPSWPTAGFPRPFGMPPFLLTLSDQDVAATLSHIRTAWGNQASEVSTAQVHALRSRTSTAAQR